MIDGGKKFVFVFGLHRSGTSLVFKALKAHPEISGFDGTGVPEDEGQHLQTVVPTAKSLGGPGMSAFHPDAPMREDHPLATEVNARRLLAEWEHHWDLRRPVLIEKSPPTLIRTRFFQRLFPEAHFVCVTRHPAAVAYATQRWSQTTIQDLIDHWRRAHEIFAEDRPRLARAMTLKYEDFVAEPERVLGEIQRFASVFDLDEPGTLEAGPHGGLLRDLGSHVVDQAIWLFGAVQRVSAHLEWADLPEGRTDAGFALRLDHVNGTASFLSASKLNRVNRRVLDLYGAGGAYLATGSDVQTGAIKAGRRPKDDPAGWGFEPEQHWGRLFTAAGERVVPSVQGNHAGYYTAFARAIADGTPVPVPVSDAIQVLAVLDAARTSASEHRTVDLDA